MSRLRWLLWLVVVAASMWQIVRTEIVTDVTSFLPGAANADQRLLADQLRNGLSTRIVLVALQLPREVDGASPSAATTLALTKASRALRDTLAARQEIAWVSNGDIAAHDAERKRLFSARYLLVDGASITDDGKRFSRQELAAAFVQLEQALASMRGRAISAIAPADPTMDSIRLFSEAKGVTAPMATEGVWLTADRQAAVLVFEARARGDDVEALRETIRLAGEAAASVLVDWPPALARPTVELAGAGYFIVKSHDALIRDAERLSLLATVLVACLLLWALRSPLLIGLAAIPVATGALAGFAVVGWQYGSVHGITLAFGVTLIGEAVDYAIYAFVQRDRQGRHSSRFWRQLGLATATSLIGFLAMLLSGFQGLHQLGIFSIVGLVVAAVCTRWLLPPLFPPVRAHESVPLDRFAWLPTLVLHLSRLRLPLALFALTALAMLVASHDRLWNDSLDVISASSKDEAANDLRFRREIGVPDLRSLVVVRGTTLNDALERTEATSQWLDTLVREGKLQGYDSPGTLLPSEGVARRRAAALPETDILRERVAQAVTGTRLRAEAFEPFIEAVAAAKKQPHVDRAFYDGTMPGHWLAAQVVTNSDGVSVLISLRGVTSQSNVKDAFQTARLPGVSMLDLQSDVETLVAGFRQRTLFTALLGGIGILVLLALQVRARRAVLAMATSLTVAVIITAWALWMIEGSLTIFNVVALLLVAGVTSNYTLFVSTLSVAAAERQQAAASVLLAAASTFVAFAMLSMSASPVLAMIGRTVALGVTIGLLASLVFAPALPVANETGCQGRAR